MKKGMKIRFPKFYDFRFKLLQNLTKHDDLTDKVINHISTKDRKILDVYCKTGMFTIKIAKNRPHAQVVGMDHHEFIRFAKRNKRQHHVRNLEFINLGHIDMPYLRFDVVTLFFALNDLTVDYIQQLLGKLKKILKANRKLVIVDYTLGKNKVTQIFLKCYHFIFRNKNVQLFTTMNLCDLLKEQGFYQIKKEEYNGIKLITSFNRGE